MFENMKQTWTEAQEKCQEEGLMTATHTDIEAIAIRKVILDKYGIYHSVSLSTKCINNCLIVFYLH